MSCNTPVLLIAWQRPCALRQVVNALRRVRPTSIFVACDGPRVDKPADVSRVAETQKLINTEIDWKCRIEKRYSETNQGCRLGVSSAISWFFEHVDEGIILEDDCVPHHDFFRFCGALLNRYRNNKQLWCITGDNFQDGRRRGHESYYFSRYNHVWGWATWRDRWLSYDQYLRFWPSWRDSSHFADMFLDQQERDYWRRIFDDTYAGKIDTWDYQWTACTWKSGGLTATPQVNLVTNIGHGSGGTHITESVSSLCIASQVLGEITHPEVVEQHSEADSYVFRNIFQPTAVQPPPCKKRRGVISRLFARIATRK